MTAYDGDLDQIVFRWSPRTLTGGRGVGPVAASAEADRLRLWSERLGPEIWAAEDTDEHDPGLSYLRFGPEAAVLRKVAVPDENGRPGSTFTHALVGPAERLTPEVALEARHWSGWRTPQDELPPDNRLASVHIASLGFPAPIARLDATSAAEVAALIGHILAAPDARFTVIEPRSVTHRLVRAVLDIAGPIGTTPWTFAIHETSDTGRDDIRLIVLSREPEFSSHTVPRQRVRLGEATPFAHALVETYLRSGRAGLARIGLRRPFTDAAQVARWEAEVHVAPGVLGDVVDLLRRTRKGELSSYERAFLRGDDGQHYLLEAVGTLTDDDLAALIAEWDDLGTGIGRRMHAEILHRCVRGDRPPDVLIQTARTLADDDLLRRALDARLGDMKGIERHDRGRAAATAIAVALSISPTVAPSRAPKGKVLREPLELRAYFMPELVGAYGDRDPRLEHALARLLTLAYGPEIVHSVDEAREVLERCSHHPAAHAVLAEYAREQHTVAFLHRTHPPKTGHRAPKDAQWELLDKLWVGALAAFLLLGIGTVVYLLLTGGMT